MKPRIEIIQEKKFIGMSIEMSLADNKTFQLFSTFMPRKKEILHQKNQDIYDLIIYPNNYFQTFNPTSIFKKHALIEVLDVEKTPEGMESFILPKGKYAVFTFEGHIPNQENFEYIFTKWLPQSSFNLDQRPHFDILTEKIQRKAPDAKQEVWIPITPK